MNEFDTGRIIRPLQKALDDSKEMGIDAVLCSTEIIEKVIMLLKEQKNKKEIKIDKENTIKEFEKICDYTMRQHEAKVLNDVLVLLKEPIEIKELQNTELNINDCVKVKLTDHGYKIHIKHYEKYCGGIFDPNLYAPVEDNDGYTKYQLWEFMSIFGEHMYNGAEPVTENNLIFLDNKMVNTVDITRCKDCVYYIDENKPKYLPCRVTEKLPDWYCADGRKKDD